MMQYIGLDLHAKSFSISVLDDQSRPVWADTAPTCGEELVRRVTALSGAKTVALEEGTLADWAFRLLSPFATVIVVDPRHNRWIAGDEKIDDETAARKLAELLRAGLVKPVYHSESAERQTFKELVQAYHDQTKQVTRCKNKIKAKFRARAIPCAGGSVYNPRDRDEWLAKLPGEGVRIQVQFLWENLDHLECQKQQLQRHVAQLARQFPQVKRFQRVPGVGPIRAATFVAVIDTPHRFPTKGKLWSYCGIGIAGQKSGQTTGPEHLTYFGNRVLKHALKGAALRAIQAGGSPFADKYSQQINSGIAPELARLSVARSIANTLWAMWRRDEDYQPDRAHPWDDNTNSNGRSE